MKRNLALCVCFVILISGCKVLSPTTATASSEPSRIILETASAPLESGKTTLVATDTPVPNVAPTLEIVQPNNIDICPSTQAVSIDKLGLPDDLALIAINADEILGGNLGSPLHSDVLIYSGLSPYPQRIEKIRSSDSITGIINILMSRSGKYLAIIRWDASKNRESLWVSTVDGQKQWMVADVAPRQRISWINDNEILIVGTHGEEDYEGYIPETEVQPLLRINPLSSEVRTLDTLPENGIYIHNSYHLINGEPYSLYYKTDGQKKTYFLHDYTRKKSDLVFWWLEDDPTVGVGIRSNGLYYAARRVDGGVDFAVDLTFEQILNGQLYNNMKRLLLSSDDNLGISIMFTWAGSDLPIVTSYLSDDQKPAPFYIYDYKNNLLKNYCLNLTQAFGTFSPDEQFVAFTVSKGIDNPGYYILLLNLETGQYSILDNTKAIGFGVTH